MKSTGVIRKIDDLGRIVIPKEIRKNLRVKNGDNLEIFIDEDSIILKKYSMIEKIPDIAQTLTDAVYTFIKHTIIITDTDNVIAATGPLKDKYLNKHISHELEESILRREKLIQNYFKPFKVIDNEKMICSYITTTIILSGEVVGMIVILDEKEKVGDIESQVANVVSSFITKYLEE